MHFPYLWTKIQAEWKTGLLMNKDIGPRTVRYKNYTTLQLGQQRDGKLIQKAQH